MKILSRYVLREHLGPLLFALSALTSLLLLNYIAKQFEKLVGKGLEWTVIGEFFMLSIPFTVAMTLPMAVLVSVLYAFSHLAAENEITAIKASGIGMFRIVGPVMLGATALAALMVGFNDQVLPRANHRLSVLQQDLARKKPTFALREQVLNEVSPGRLWLRTGRIDPASNRMREVTIIDHSNPQTPRSIYADSGLMEMSEGQADLILTLHDGTVNELSAEEPGRLQRIFFVKDVIRVRGVGNELVRSESGGYKTDREMSICEMQVAANHAYAEYAMARHELEQMLVGSTHQLATGQPAVRAAPEFETRPGIGRVYCRALALITPERSADTVVASGPPEAGENAQGGNGEVVGVARATPLDTLPAVAGGSAAGGSPRPLREGSGGGLSAGGLARSAPAAGRARQSVGAVARAAATPARPPAPSTGRFLGGMAANTPADAVASRIDIMRSQLDVSRAQLQRYDLEIQKKFALAVACIVFVLLGAPIALRFPRGGVGLTLSVSLIVFALYYIALIGGESLSNKGLLSPFWAMWAANILFGTAGIILFLRMGREGNTSRGGDAREILDGLRSALARAARRLGIPVERRRRLA